MFYPRITDFTYRLLILETESPQQARASVPLFLSRRRNRQRAVVAFALLPGNASLISDSRELSRSLISPAEHVGKQIEGAAGCRASGRSGGIARSGDKLGDLLAQAVSSSIGSISSSARLFTLFCSIFSIPLLLTCYTIAFVTCDDELANSLRLSFYGARLVSVSMAFEISGRRTDDHRRDDREPNPRIEPGHSPSEYVVLVEPNDAVNTCRRGRVPIGARPM